MKKFAMMLGLAAVMAFAVGFTMTGTANADDTLTTDSNSALTLDSGADPDHRGRRGRRGPRMDACGRAAHEVAKSCPCEGIDGVAWTDAAVYLQCVNTVLEDLDVDDECATRIRAKAEESGIGTPDHECPEGCKGRRGGHERPEDPELP